MVVLAVLVLGRDRRVVPPEELTPRPDRTGRSVLAGQALAELEKAVAGHDSAAATALGVPHVVANGDALEVMDFGLRYIDEDEGAFSAGSDRWVAAVQTSWRFARHDAAVALTEVAFTFEQSGDEPARIVEIGGHGRRSPLWLSGPVTVRRAGSALVLVAGGAELADSYASYAGAAVPVVRRVLDDWRGDLVVEVPGSADGLDEVLAAKAGEYAQIAAVTTTVDGSVADRAPVHVFVNPDVFGQLRPRGAQVVMSHEAAHVATMAATDRMPMWLLEGFADYVALRDVDLPLSVTAGQVAAQVRRDGLPKTLPGPAEFDTRTSHLGAAYEAAWLACVTLAERGGEDRLVRFYEAVSDGQDQQAALQDVFGFSEQAFVSMWQERLQDLAA